MDTPTGRAVKEALFHDIEGKIKLALERSRQAKELRLQSKAAEIQEITVKNAEQNNLKSVNVKIPRHKLTVCTGPSGSGKSSLAFDTIYAEGQRRYIESLSPYARQFVKQMPKPKVGYVDGLSPAIAIEQKAHAGNPRSTVGTMTEIYDYLRLLYARIGIPHDPDTGEVIRAISKEHVVEKILQYEEGEKVQILAPIEIRKSEKFEDILSRLRRLGFLRIRLNNQFYDLDMPEPVPYDRKRKNELYLVIDRLKINPTMHHRLFEAIENASAMGKEKLLVVREETDIFFNLAFAVESTGRSFPEITPHTFAFNTVEGMCLDCSGLGYQYGANVAQRPEFMPLCAVSLLRIFWGDKHTDHADTLFWEMAERLQIDPYCPLSELPPKQLNILMNGSGETYYTSKKGFLYKWAGIHPVLAKAGKASHADIRNTIIPLLDEQECPACQGSRINPLARNVTINGYSIDKLCGEALEKSLTFIKEMVLPQQEQKLLEEVRKQLLSRLSFLVEVGLQYLSLDRRAPTLSGGEAQRIRLARQFSSGLTGVLYVLDEPTIGLHPRDNDRLNQALKQLRDLGNTMLMVEHDPLTIATADYILDFGPHSGERGGHITAKGSYEEILENPHSLTGRYLSGKIAIPVPSKRRPGKGLFLRINKANVHNLKNITVEIPVGVMTCFTGVSGSGKSTLMNQVLLPAVQKAMQAQETIINGIVVEGIDHFDKVISIDQNPVGHTVRSDVGTYVDVLTRMREFYASLPLSKVKGLQPKHFSYNHRKGMCTACWGLGYRKVEMHFLPPVKVVCEDCQGMRLNPVSLEATYKGKNFGEWLDTTVEEARIGFENHPRIIRILDTLISVGLGYLKLGQEVVSLSGGEAQRIKLSRELAKRATGKTLYLLDEPTTGLHSEDILKLLTVLHKLVDKGNTMIVIEHNLDLIKNADWIIDLGPEAGEKGGCIVAAGTPEAVAKLKKSHTGRYLKKYLT